MKKIFLFIISGFSLLFINKSNLMGFDGNCLNSNDLYNEAKLMGFDGDYFGDNDPLLQFDGGAGANWVNGEAKHFTMTISNTFLSNKEVVILPGLDHDYIRSNGTIDDTDDQLNVIDERSKAVVNDGIFMTNVAGKTLSANGSPSSIYSLLTFLKFHPSFLYRMKLRASSTSQFEQYLKIKKINPFFTEREEIKPLTQFSSVADYRTDMMDIQIPLAVDTLTQLSIIIPAGCTTDITLFFGPSLNTGKYLETKFKQAQEAVILNGSDAVRIQQELKNTRMGMSKATQLRRLS